MGHKTIQMTMRYADLAPAHNLAAVERLNPGVDRTLPMDASATRSVTDHAEPASEGFGSCINCFLMC
jgi:hypothetical protein